MGTFNLRNPNYVVIYYVDGLMFTSVSIKITFVAITHRLTYPDDFSNFHLKLSHIKSVNRGVTSAFEV